MVWAGVMNLATFTQKMLFGLITSLSSGYDNLSNSDIIKACEDNGQACQAYTSEMRFNIRGSDVGRYYEFTFKSGKYYQPTGGLKVSIIGYTTAPVVLASKTVSMAADTTYHVHIGEFS